jgi:hypothetical protein
MPFVETSLLMLVNTYFSVYHNSHIKIVTTSCGPALGPIQPAVQQAQEFPSPGLTLPGCEADHFLHLMPRSRKLGIASPFHFRLHGLVLN